jgi:hypothetical protein
MKKIFTFLFTASITTLFSQSFSAYRMNNALTATVQTLTNGGVRNEATSANSTNSFHIKLVNNSASTLTLSVLRTVVYNNPALLLDGQGNTPDSYFCFGQNCFGSNVNTPPSTDYCTLLASGNTSTVAPPYSDNSEDCGTPFTVYLKEGTVQGKYFIRYRLYNVANANDTLTFDLRYNEFLGVNSISDPVEDVSDVYPSPSVNTANLNITLKRESPVKVQVYNSIGALVYSGQEQKLATGKNKLSIDCSNYSSGVYFVSISTADSKITRRLIIDK